MIKFNDCVSRVEEILKDPKILQTIKFLAFGKECVKHVDYKKKLGN